MEKLLELGFKKVGIWKKNEKTLSFELSEFKDSTDIIFAFVQNSTVVYMATALGNFETFLTTYINPSSIDLDKAGIKNSLLKSLDDKEIAIYALKNKKWFGLATRFTPIQISNIIKEINPSWNSDDLKDRMKNIVGKDRNAVLKSEKEKAKERELEKLAEEKAKTEEISTTENIEIENENSDENNEEVENNDTSKKVVSTKKAKKQHETYIFILGKSYYERGFFNLKTSYSHLVGEDKTDIQIVVGEKQTILGKVSRTANVSNTARIIGNKPLKIWFQENATVNCELRITFISKKKIKLEIA